MKRIAEPRYEPLTIDGEEFEVLANPPLALLGDIQSGNADRLVSAMRRIFHRHPYVNGATDDEGQPLPADIGDLDKDEAGPLIKAYTVFLTDLPKA